jgi:hypothetical protein
MSDVHAIADRLEIEALRSESVAQPRLNTADMARRLMAALSTEDGGGSRGRSGFHCFQTPEIVCRTSLLHVETCLVTPPTSPGDHR